MYNGSSSSISRYWLKDLPARKWWGTWDSTEVMVWLSNFTTNPGQTKVAKWSLGISLHYKEPPKEHLTAKGFPGFVVEFNSYNIPAVNSPVAYHSFAGRTSITSDKTSAPAPYKTGNWHGIININAVIIKFHNKSWPAAMDLLWNLIIPPLMLMIPCQLPQSCRERPSCDLQWHVVRITPTVGCLSIQSPQQLWPTAKYCYYIWVGYNNYSSSVGGLSTPALLAYKIDIVDARLRKHALTFENR